MTSQHYAELCRILNVNSARLPNRAAVERAAITSMRARWDLFWAATGALSQDERQQFMASLYKYLNDDHIDTALRRYFTRVAQVEEEA